MRASLTGPAPGGGGAAPPGTALAPGGGGAAPRGAALAPGGGGAAPTNASLAPVFALAGLAAALWLVMFSPMTAPRVPFWHAMTLSAGVLGLTALLLDRRRLGRIYAFRPRDALLGLAAAAALYGVFFVGDRVAAALFDFARPEVGRIYALKDQGSATIIGLALALWIGPAEEVFWRGFVQRRLAERWGGLRGFLVAAALYAAVHLWAGNAMLLGAASVCGVFWGLLYWRTGSLWPGILSHALWDLAVFIVFPIA